MDIRDELKRKRIFFDGGMGSMLGCEACEKKDCPYRRSLGQGRET